MKTVEVICRVRLLEVKNTRYVMWSITEPWFGKNIPFLMDHRFETGKYKK